MALLKRANDPTPARLRPVTPSIDAGSRSNPEPAAAALAQRRRTIGRAEHRTRAQLLKTSGPVAARRTSPDSGRSASRAGYPVVMFVTPGSGEGQPDAEREARRAARSERREAPAERPGVMTPSGRRRLPLEAQLKHVVTTGGIVGIGIVVVVVAAIMTSQDSKGWLIGLVVSIVSIGLAALLWSSRRL
jgi:hypothetical protein